MAVVKTILSLHSSSENDSFSRFIILDTYGMIMKIKIIYCVFRIILDTYGIIMQNENHIYYVFRIILDTYGIIMKIQIIYIVFFGLFRHLWNYNENTNHIY